MNLMNGAVAEAGQSATGADSSLPPSACLALPELLAPAGNWLCAKAAVENGADAIYFGLERFNARMRAHNFTLADLPSLMEFLQRRGVKGYVTFNTLIFQNEMAEAEQHLRSIIAAGVDAAIVQDIGICRLIRQLSPDFPIHASTQMTITSAAGVQFARELGCNVVVLARECSMKEMAEIHSRSRRHPQNGDLTLSRQGVSSLSSLGGEGRGEEAVCSRGANPTPALEVFVHGALCVAYSGQCLTSEALGGRSANRGECAQACRMPYDLIADGQPVPLGDRRYLLSPQDLAGLEVLPDLIKTGVGSLKIEGRLKTPEYVASITRIYREALDTCAASAISNPKSETRNPRYEMEMAFSRGLHTGWLRGINNQQLVHARFGKKRGVFLGEVARLQGKVVFVRLQGPLKPGDGVVFDAGHPDAEEQGGRVYGIKTTGRDSALQFGDEDIDVSRLHVGDKLWKTSDPELDHQLRQTFAGEQPRFQRSLGFDVRGGVGEPMMIQAHDETGLVVEVSSAMPMTHADKQPLTTDRLREQLGRLGNTPFRLGELRNHLDSSVILPLSELNRLRREIVEQLETLRAQPRRWALKREAPPAEALGVGRDRQERNVSGAPELIVLVRNLSQLESALSSGVRTLYCEFEDPKKYREAVRQFRPWQQTASSTIHYPSSIHVAPPRIFKTGEEWILKQVRSSEPDGFLVRNYDHLNYFADAPRIGDFSLNVANRLTADYFINHFGLQRVTASYDLNMLQLESLLQAAPPEWFEVTIHQHIPMFHMEHCVFCAFLSQGTDYTNCGRPCDHREVKLRDRVGAEHLVKADAGCRNTVFNAKAQTGAEYVARLLALGLRRFRIEFVSESPAEVAQTIARYQQLLRGEITGQQLWREFKLLRQLGVTRGAMEKQ